MLGHFLGDHPAPALRQFLLEGFSAGFHTGLITLPTETFECNNLRSAENNPAIVDELLQAELSKGFLIGPFPPSPFSMWRVSPIGVVSGKFSNKFRLIYDLSAPHSSHIPSLNSLIPSEEFSLKYSSVDLAIQHILQLGRGAWLSKADITDAFKLLPISPALWQWHGIKWRGQYFFATKLTFGSKSSPFLFDTFAQALHWILEDCGSCQRVIHYLDDFLLLEDPGRPPRDLQVLTGLFSGLVVPLAAHKMEGPAKVITFLGITLDSDLMVASLPMEKLARIRQVIHRFVRSPVCSKRDLQSLLGMLNHAMRIIPQGRAFVSRLLAVLPQGQDSDSPVRLPTDAQADLIMWDRFLCHWNGISMFIPHPTESSPRVFSDAAASVGFSAIFGQEWLASSWPPEVFHLPKFALTSALFEIYPILAAAVTWGPGWAGNSVIFFTDNLATARIINKGRSGSLLIMSFMRKLTWLGLTYRFHFQGEFIRGDHNGAADALSRLNMPQFFFQHPAADRTGQPIPPYALLVMD